MEKTYGLHRDARWHKVPCGIAGCPFFGVNQGYNEFPQVERSPAAALESGRMIRLSDHLEPCKGLDLILDAAAASLRADPTAHIVLVDRVV